MSRDSAQCGARGHDARKLSEKGNPKVRDKPHHQVGLMTSAPPPVPARHAAVDATAPRTPSALLVGGITWRKHGWTRRRQSQLDKAG